MNNFPNPFERERIKEMLAMVQDLLKCLTSSNNSFSQILAVLNEMKQWATNHAEIRMYLFDAMDKLIAIEHRSNGHCAVDIPGYTANLNELPANECVDRVQAANARWQKNVSQLPRVRVRNDLFSLQSNGIEHGAEAKKRKREGANGTPILAALLPLKLENETSDDNSTVHDNSNGDLEMFPIDGDNHAEATSQPPPNSNSDRLQAAPEAQPSPKCKRKRSKKSKKKRASTKKSPPLKRKITATNEDGAVTSALHSNPEIRTAVNGSKGIETNSKAKQMEPNYYSDISEDNEDESFAVNGINASQLIAS